MGDALAIFRDNNDNPFTGVVLDGEERFNAKFGIITALIPAARAEKVAIDEVKNLASAARSGTRDLVETTAGAMRRAATGDSPQVLLDSNVTTGLKADPTLGGRVLPDETPVISYVTTPEMRNAVVHGNLRGVPSSLNDLQTIVSIPSLDLRINIRAMLPAQPGRFGDGIIGAQAIENGLPLVTNDVALRRAVNSLGGEVR